MTEKGGRQVEGAVGRTCEDMANEEAHGIEGAVGRTREDTADDEAHAHRLPRSTSSTFLPTPSVKFRIAVKLSAIFGSGFDGPSGLSPV